MCETASLPIECSSQVVYVSIAEYAASSFSHPNRASMFRSLSDTLNIRGLLCFSGSLSIIILLSKSMFSHLSRLLQNPEIKKQMDEADRDERRQARLALKRWEESRKNHVIM